MCIRDRKSAAELMDPELGWTSVYAYDKEVLGEKVTLFFSKHDELKLAKTHLV